MKKKLPAKKTQSKKTVKRKASPRKIKHKIRTSYLRNVYEPEFFKRIPEAVEIVQRMQKKLEFDAIAFTGISGMSFGFPLSYLLKLPVINIRKDWRDTGSHYRGRIEGTVSSRRYLIVDDFISTGDTVKNIIKIIHEELGGKAIPVGLFLHNSGAMNPQFEYLKPGTNEKRTLQVVTLPYYSGS
jgi:adenine/guanine phosphoribosyltransferase-like PRPP-binding protein